MKLNKKAQTGHTIIKSITWFIFLIIVLLAITLLVKSHIQTTIDIKDIESELFYQELMFTRDGISYQDKLTTRTYPGIIDLSKFNKNTLIETVSYGKNNYFIAANFSLMKQDRTLIESFLYNEDWFKKWKPLAKTGLLGPGGATILKKQNYVLVKDTTTYPAILNVEIIYPNK